mgnify:CR=1 FL=1
MAKSTAEVEKFIELRAQGYSFDKISEETGISKPTLLKWSKEFGRELGEAQFYELQALLQQYGLMRKNRVEGVSVLLQAVIEEIKKRAGNESLSRLPTDKLFSLYLALESRLEEETEGRKIDLSPLGAYQFGEVAEVD